MSRPGSLRFQSVADLAVIRPSASCQDGLTFTWPRRTAAAALPGPVRRPPQVGCTGGLWSSEDREDREDRAGGRRSGGQAPDTGAESAPAGRSVSRPAALRAVSVSARGAD